MKWRLAVALLLPLLPHRPRICRISTSPNRFPAASPAYVAINVDKTGAGDYREARK